jgi:hypothetical protein
MAIGAFTVDVSTFGDDRVVERFFRMKRDYPGAFAAAMYTIAVNVITTAMKITPVLTGYLRNSRYVVPPTAASASFMFEGGFSAPHAVYVHEVYALHRVGQWKFLSTALRWHQATFVRDVAALTSKFAAASITMATVPILMPTAPMQGPYQRQRGTFRASLQHMTRGERKKAWSGRRKERARVARDIVKNQERIHRETAATLSARRRGMPETAPRPGRG